MTNPDLITWTNATAALLTAELPLQSLDSAVNFAFSYVSNVGGWIPDNIASPNGPGHPANNATSATAAAAIAATQIGDVYDLNFNIAVTMECQFTAKLGPGLTLNSAAAALAADVTNFITNSVNNSNAPVRVNSVGTQTAISANSLLGGNTTTAVRVVIAADLAGPNKIVDYKEIALQYAKTINGLNNTWNVQSVYTQTSSPIVVTIAKYTSTAYTTLDSSSHTIYVYSVSPTTYEIVTGVIIRT